MLPQAFVFLQGLARESPVYLLAGCGDIYTDIVYQLGFPVAPSGYQSPLLVW